MPQLTQTLIDMKNNPEGVTLDSPAMSNIQCFIIAGFSRNCEASSVNEARQKMFTTGLKTLETIPPTKNALYQHVKLALLASAFIWRHCTDKSPNIPYPKDWGWEWNQRITCWVLVPFWTDLPDVSKGCSILVHCGCKKVCSGRCECYYICMLLFSDNGGSHNVPLTCKDVVLHDF